MSPLFTSSPSSPSSTAAPLDLSDTGAAQVSSADLERMRGLTARPLRFTERHPAFFPWAVRLHRARRRVQWLTSRTRWARQTHPDPATVAHDFPARVKVHKSLLLRTLGESEMWLQHGKVTNLRLACKQVNGIVIRPGETFSFNKVVGNCTRRKGYVEGMRLSNGTAMAGVGGGICQLGNLLHWMVLHSPLTVTERSVHSFDPFPDNGRVLPWGSGCSIVYNYVDLAFRNDTDLTFVITVHVGERYLEGEIRADRTPEHSYTVHAENEQFLQLGAEYFRRNELWRTVRSRATGRTVGEELVRRNCALVKYVPEGVEIEDITPLTGTAPDPRAA